jgi:hypothetical protein
MHRRSRITDHEAIDLEEGSGQNCFQAFPSSVKAFFIVGA